LRTHNLLLLLIKPYRRLTFVIGSRTISRITAVATGFARTFLPIAPQQFKSNNDCNYGQRKNLLGGFIHINAASNELIREQCTNVTETRHIDPG